MRKVLSGETRGLPDAESFVRALQDPTGPEDPAARALFDPAREIVVARAPGRLDLMGGIADYSGSLVLQWPLREATLVAAQRTAARRVRVVSLGAEETGRSASFDIALDELVPRGKALAYDEARAFFAKDPARRWAGYAAGTLVALMREKGATFGEGLTLLVRSDVPEGKGVSSSAALEVATMTAVTAAFDLPLAPRDLALLCQLVENRVVGAPCGVMDQMTSACGRPHELLALLCQPAELLGTIPLPAGLAVWGLDSGERHAVSGSDYAGVRVGAFMGARILEDVVRASGPGAYLANVTPSVLEGALHRLPDTISGAEFLARYSGTADTVARVDPARTYAVRPPTAHPVFEHFRVRAFAELLCAPASRRRNEVLGELMRQSHASYSACGLGSPATDAIVNAAAGLRGDGFHGAKITGGGSGGTVAVLGDDGADVTALVEACARALGRRPRVFEGSSPGASAFGVIRLGPEG